VAVYRELRQVSGLSPKTAEAAAAGLPNTWYGVMAALTRELERRVPDSAFVSLIADGDARHLYARFGFTETAPASVGMARAFPPGSRPERQASRPES
jgi:hypothetical protein